MCLRFFLFAEVISTTTITPSTLLARMLASERPSSGGVSKTMISAPEPERMEKKRSIAFESSNSGGFGGKTPEGMTRKFGTSTACTYDSSEKPGASGRLDCPLDGVGVMNCSWEHEITALLKPALSEER